MLIDGLIDCWVRTYYTVLLLRLEWIFPPFSIHNYACMHGWDFSENTVDRDRVVFRRIGIGVEGSTYCILYVWAASGRWKSCHVMSCHVMSCQSQYRTVVAMQCFWSSLQGKKKNVTSVRSQTVAVFESINQSFSGRLSYRDGVSVLSCPILSFKSSDSLTHSQSVFVEFFRTNKW